MPEDTMPEMSPERLAKVKANLEASKKPGAKVYDVDDVFDEIDAKLSGRTFTRGERRA